MHFLRHIVVRSCLTIFFWILLALWILPILQHIIGIRWLMIPAILLFYGIFEAIGWCMQSIAQNGIDRLLEEAVLYERTGMNVESGKCLQGAVALLDGCLLSPKGRGHASDKVLIRAAQHRLARSGKTTALDQWVLAYLDRFPKDEDAAGIWLQSAMQLEHLPPKSFDLIATLSQAQPQNDGLQHLLGRIFLAERRTDFEALQVYRRILACDGHAGSSFLIELAHLLAAEGLFDEWALAIYLNAYTTAPNSPEILRGILLSVGNISDHERNRPLLLRARDLLAQTQINHPNAGDIEETLCTLKSSKTLVAEAPEETMGLSDQEETLIPTQASATQLIPHEHRRLGRTPGEKIRRKIQVNISHLRLLIRSLTAKIQHVSQNTDRSIILRWTAIGAVFAGVLFFAVNIVSLISKSQETSQAPEIHKSTAPTDPFALQVAAYSSQSDAQKYMHELKRHNLNAYLTEAHGRDKKWYQVRISHFTDPKEAKIFGEKLKSQGVINDYYVANYKPPLEE